MHKSSVVLFCGALVVLLSLGFSAVIGFLWLGTVPLTSGIIAQIFGPR